MYIDDNTMNCRALKSHAGILILCLSALVLSFLIPHTVHAADTQGVTVLASNNALGAVFCTRNDVSFTHYTYAASTDYIKVSALPVNTNYQFVNWTDNGVIVSNSSSYSFNVGSRNHVVVAHFDSKAEKKHKRYDTDNNISSITRNTNACVFASGYKQDGMTINTSLVPLDDASTNAVEVMTGGSFLGAFQIQFTYGYDGKAKSTLDQTTRLVLQLPVNSTGTCKIIDLSSATPSVLEDLDTDTASVTFDAKNSGLYVVTDGAASPAATVPDASTVTPAATVPDASTVTPAATVPEIPAVAPAQPIAPVTQEQYQESVINILRYQLQQAGLTPAA